MKIFYHAPDGGLNSTDSKSALAIYITIGVMLFLAASALLDAALQIIPGGATGITIKEWWIEILIIVLSFNAVLHGISWGSGWSKRHTEPKVAQAEAMRAHTNGHAPAPTPVTPPPLDVDEAGDEAPRGRSK